MCLSTPKMPNPAAPLPPPQQAKAPNLSSFTNRNAFLPLMARKGSVNNGMLTGSTGVAPGQVNLAQTSLLGGGK